MMVLLTQSVSSEYSQKAYGKKKTVPFAVILHFYFISAIYELNTLIIQIKTTFCRGPCIEEPLPPPLKENIQPIF